MLRATVPGAELFDEEKQQFITRESITLKLEHSLASISKWESYWKKPFLGKEEEKTTAEVNHYINCMSVDGDIPDETFSYIPNEIYSQITDYINDPMTATWFKEDKSSARNKDVLTSEVLYYYMIAQNVPIECENWHLNRLITLLRVCGEKNQPQKKMNKKDWIAQRRALNEARRSRFNTKG
jgi:hypothetical protein